MHKFETTLQFLCMSTTDQVFASLAALGFEVTYVGKRRYAYREGQSPTSPMVVCHADTVVKGGNGPHNYKYSKATGVVTSIALDDRLGIACMVHAIATDAPLAQCAMLVCDEEETGNSSAAIFSTYNAPNWLVELDRRGTDAVCYEYDTPLLRSLLKHVGFDIGNGSFSDICYLESLGVCGFNVGVGYHNEHSETCHANLHHTLAQVAKLEAFLAQFGDVRLDHETWPKWSSYSSASTTSRSYSDVYEEYDEDVDAIQEAIDKGYMTFDAECVYDKYGFCTKSDPLDQVLVEIVNDYR